MKMFHEVEETILIILFDGVCNLCNKSVQFIIKRDPNMLFSFTSLQSEIGKKLLKEHQVPDNLTSVILIKNGKAFTQSDAALEICLHLTKGWRLLYLCKIIPRYIRNYLYQFIANNRYKWFGRSESCMVPTKEMRKRFLQ